MKKKGIKHLPTSSSYQNNRKKKDRDKILSENWRPMSLVNVDLTRGKPQIPSSSFLGFLNVSRSSYNNYTVRFY